MKPENLPAEIKYRIDERLALSGYFSAATTEPCVLQQVRKEVIAEVKAAWPDAFRVAVERGIVTP